MLSIFALLNSNKSWTLLNEIFTRSKNHWWIRYFSVFPANILPHSIDSTFSLHERILVLESRVWCSSEFYFFFLLKEPMFSYDSYIKCVMYDHRLFVWIFFGEKVDIKNSDSRAHWPNCLNMQSDARIHLVNSNIHCFHFASSFAQNCWSYHYLAKSCVLAISWR